MRFILILKLGRWRNGKRIWLIIIGFWVRVLLPPPKLRKKLKNPFYKAMHLKQTVKTLYLQQICGSKSIVANRNPYAPVAQLVEHLIFNQGVPRSNRGRRTINRNSPIGRDKCFRGISVRVQIPFAVP